LSNSYSNMLFSGFNNCHLWHYWWVVLMQDRQCSNLWLPIGIHCGTVCVWEYPSSSLLVVWIDEWIYRLCNPNLPPNSMLLNMFKTVGIPNSYSYGWSIHVPATFCNSTCLVIPILMWKGTKG
jgi:hypothetical protein